MVALPTAVEATGNASCQTININDTLFPSSIETLGIQLFVYGCNSSLEEDLCRALESQVFVVSPALSTCRSWLGFIQWEEVKFDNAGGVFSLSAEGKTSTLFLYKLQTTGSSEIACSMCFMHIANIG